MHNSLVRLTYTRVDVKLLWVNVNIPLIENLQTIDTFIATFNMWLCGCLCLCMCFTNSSIATCVVTRVHSLLVVSLNEHCQRQVSHLQVDTCLYYWNIYYVMVPVFQKINKLTNDSNHGSLSPEYSSLLHLYVL